MSNPITRRTALAGAGALPLLPVSAYAKHAEDPAVTAYEEWRLSFDAYEDSFDHPGGNGSDAYVKPFHDREIAAGMALVGVVATTPEGLACQIRRAFYTFGDVDIGGDWHNPDDFTVEGFGMDQARQLLRSMLAGAQRLAEAQS